MPGALYLCSILEFIIYSFNDSPLSEQQFVRKTYQRSFHIAFQLNNELYAVNEKLLGDILTA